MFATDDWFAHAENLLSSAEPVWKEGFTEQVNLFLGILLLSLGDFILGDF